MAWPAGLPQSGSALLLATATAAAGRLRLPAKSACCATLRISLSHAGLGAVAARSLQAEFDDAVAALQLATDALATSRQQLAAVAAAAEGEGPAEVALAAVRQALAGGATGGPSGDLLAALQARLAEWQQRVVSHQDPSRLLRWASGKSGGSTAAAESECSGTPS